VRVARALRRASEENALRSLHPHPDVPAPEGLRLAAEAVRTGAGALRLRYRLEGDLGGVRLPAPTAPERTDELWRATCFEAFVSGGDGSYLELNFAPSTRWAAYRFERYRTGMQAADAGTPEVEVRPGPDALELSTFLHLGDLPPDRPWRLGLSAVIETVDGRISYWALAHAPGKPDFHHPDSFALDLPPPVTS